MNGVRRVPAANRKPPTQAERLEKALRDSVHINVQLGRLMQMNEAVQSEIRSILASPPERQGEQTEASLGLT
jgi:hypothetical protein